MTAHTRARTTLLIIRVAVMAALAVWCTAFSNRHYQVHNDPYVWRVTEWDTHKQACTVILIKPHSWYIWSKVRILHVVPRCATLCRTRRRDPGLAAFAGWCHNNMTANCNMRVRIGCGWCQTGATFWAEWEADTLTDRQLWRQTDMWSREMEPEVVYLPLLQVSNSVWSSPFSAMGFVKSCQIVPSLFFWVVRTRRL